MTLSLFRRRRRQQPAFNGDFHSDESITEVLERVRPADYDGRTITFAGASAGTMTVAEAHREAGLRQAVETAETGILYMDHATQPLGKLRGRPAPGQRAAPRPAYAPPPAAAGYTAGATGPLPVIGRERPAIGDALALDQQWGPALTNLPCGHCGATLDADPAVAFERTRTIGYLNWLARQAGWVYDTDLIWTCPPCQAAATWKARQGQLEVHRYGVTCQRNHLAAEPAGDCTCPGAVLAVDAMLASRDYLGSAR